MTIRLEKMIPLPLLEQQRNSSGIWGADAVLFEQGKSYLIEAPSGKGKTSLLSVIFGIRKDFRGKVFFNERDIASLSAKEWSEIRKRKLSFIFQGLELFDELTALDNIHLKNAITRERTDREIRTMAERIGMAEFLHKPAGILSFGQQQRVAIIRALCQPFEFLLADECFSHMDKENSQIALDLIQETCSSTGAGMILTSLNAMKEVEIEERRAL